MDMKLCANCKNTANQLKSGQRLQNSLLNKALQCNDTPCLTICCSMVRGDWTSLGMLRLSPLSWPWVRTLDPFIRCTLLMRTRSCEAKTVCCCWWVGLFYFLSLKLVLVVKPRTPRKKTLITVRAKNPNGEKTRTQIIATNKSSFRHALILVQK